MSTSTPVNSTMDITATPKAAQHIHHDGKEYTTVKEGLAYILVPASTTKVPQTSPTGENQPQSVFYNPIQQFNRDLSVLAIKAYGEEVMKQKIQKISASKRGKKRKREKDGGEENGNAGTKKPVPSTRPADADISAKYMPEDTEMTVTEDGDSEPSAVKAVAAGQLGGPEEKNPSAASAPNGAQTENTTSSPSKPSFTILDALSATGLRALRYSQEIPFATSVTANDLLPAATATINLNVEHNKLSDKITSITGNAITHMYSFVGDDADHRGRPKPTKKYDVIDLDPYGTAVPFLDAAVQSVRNDGGLLCVTCTDAGVWASNGYPEKAFSLYGGLPMKGLHSHEGGLRLILHVIATSAARYGLAIEPLLSLSIDFYARVFVKIRKSPADVKFLAGTTMMVYNCDSGCGAWTTQLLARNKLSKNKSGNGYFYKHVFAMGPSTGENCEHCGSKTHVAGPMYAGPLHSPAFIRKILNDLPNVSKDTYATTSRIEGMLTLALEETLPPLEELSNSDGDIAAPTTLAKAGKHDPAAIDHYPFFFLPSALSRIIHCITPHENAIRGALRHLGYRVTRSHTKGGTIKTDAPWSVIWEIMREWTRQKAPIKEGAVREGTAGYKILKLDSKKIEEGSVSEVARQDVPEVVFDEELGKEKDGKKLVRYQANPRENWGPMNRAKGH